MDNVISLNAPPKAKQPLVYFISNGPLLGSERYKTFLSWVGTMQLDITRIRMFDIQHEPFKKPFEALSLNTATQAGHIKLVTLGADVDLYVIETELEDFYSLGSPSETHPEEELADMLNKCEAYIYT